MNDTDMRSIADRCARFIVACGDRIGVADADLARIVDAYGALPAEDRLRVHLCLCSMPQLAHTAEGWLFRFYPRALAPNGAVVTRDPYAP